LIENLTTHAFFSRGAEDGSLIPAGWRHRHVCIFYAAQQSMMAFTDSLSSDWIFNNNEILCSFARIMNENTNNEES
jgi:hypothetical protein